MPAKNTAPASPPTPEGGSPAKTSLFRKIVYALIIAMAISVLLQFLGIEILGHRDTDTLIERPHDG